MSETIIPPLLPARARCPRRGEYCTGVETLLIKKQRFEQGLEQRLEQGLAVYSMAFFAQRTLSYMVPSGTWKSCYLPPSLASLSPFGLAYRGFASVFKGKAILDEVTRIVLRM